VSWGKARPESERAPARAAPTVVLSHGHQRMITTADAVSSVSCHPSQPIKELQRLTVGSVPSRRT
jgi:hypothetical protein